MEEVKILTCHDPKMTPTEVEVCFAPESRMKLLIQKHTSVCALLAASSPVLLTSIGFRLQLKCLTEISIFKRLFLRP